jgi:ATP-binding cassette subfamily B protein
VSPTRRILAYLARYRLRYAVGGGCLTLAAAFSLAIPWTVKRGVDAVAAHGVDADVLRPALAILALALAHGCARLGSRLFIVGAGQWVEHDIRSDLYARLVSLPPSFYQDHLTGDIMSRASSDVTAVRQVAGFGVVMLVGTMLTFSGAAGAMWLLDPWLTILALVPLPALVLVARAFSQAMERHSTLVQAQLGALSAKVQENLAGAAVVRAYTMESREVAQFALLNAEYRQRALGLARAQAVFSPLMGAIAGVGALIILWVGGRAVVDGRITLGTFVAFNGYLAQLAWPTVALGWTLAGLQRGVAAMERIGLVLDAAPPAATREGGQRRLSAGPMEFRGLSFAYPARGSALVDVRFAVPAGGLVAVVGPTGSGKSTLGALVCRLYEPPHGSVFLDGQDVRDLPLDVLRRSVGYVPQEAFLFSRSLHDNVLLAPTAGPERRDAAAEIAGIAGEVAAMPRGWDTVVGERGLTVSGGQRQRLALARALAGDPPFLILDDVLSAVDAGTEWAILEALRSAVAGRTTLLVTHRLRAAQEADWVVVLDEGRVVEQGRHGDLLALGGLYARLWRVQQLEDELARA